MSDITCPHPRMTSNSTDKSNTNRTNSPSPPHMLPTGDPVASAPFREASTTTSPADEKTTPSAAAMTSHSVNRVANVLERRPRPRAENRARSACQSSWSTGGRHMEIDNRQARSDQASSFSGCACARNMVHQIFFSSRGKPYNLTRALRRV
ncbi:hypothetical protein BC567DRAFT_59050 [Phyllosticta citribraziliensis]